MNLIPYLPELTLLAGALALFVVSLGETGARRARSVALATAFAAILGGVIALGESAVLFDGAYRVDLFSQFLKLVLAGAFGLILLVSGDLTDIREDIKSEYFLLLTLSVFGLVSLVSSVDLITLVISLQLSAIPLYLMVPMRREREGQRAQMESAIKYLMFGIAANGVMLFGLSYLYSATGSTSLAVMLGKLGAQPHSAVVIAGLAMVFCGVYYKLAVFPFHFWTPDVYQGAANETASYVASLPKLGAIAVFFRFATLAPADHTIIPVMFGGLALASMFYGNLIALAQKDLKRLLGFSGIAHAGYALLGMVALNRAGFAAAIFYIIAYLFMILACFVVICRVSRDGVNVSMEELAGLHRRSPLLALTLIVGMFALAGIPPFAGFIGKLALLKAALGQGFVWLVVLTVVNTAIAVYYYLSVVREACLRDAGEQPPIALDWATRALCVALIAINVVLGVAPGRVFALITAGL